MQKMLKTLEDEEEEEGDHEGKMGANGGVNTQEKSGFEEEETMRDENTEDEGSGEVSRRNDEEITQISEEETGNRIQTEFLGLETQVLPQTEGQTRGFKGFKNSEENLNLGETQGLETEGDPLKHTQVMASGFRNSEGFKDPFSSTEEEPLEGKLGDTLGQNEGVEGEEEGDDEGEIGEGGGQIAAMMNIINPELGVRLGTQSQDIQYSQSENGGSEFGETSDV